MSERAVHVFIEGRVQGVWFRGWTKQEAKRLGISGWVRNLHDGRVEAVFAGPADVVDRLLELCRQGPPLARVEQVMVSETEAPDSHGFETRPTA